MQEYQVKCQHHYTTDKSILFYHDCVNKIFRDSRVVRREDFAVDGGLGVFHTFGESQVRAGREVGFDVDGSLGEDGPGQETEEKSE